MILFEETAISSQEFIFVIVSRKNQEDPWQENNLFYIDPNSLNLKIDWAYSFKAFEAL